MRARTFLVQITYILAAGGPKKKGAAIATPSISNTEPQVGIEPTTARLRIECSTPELLWQHTVFMPWRGLEPRRLAAPPPQDGVSTNFTTRALPLRACCEPHSVAPEPTAPAISYLLSENKND